MRRSCRAHAAVWMDATISPNQLCISSFPMVYLPERGRDKSRPYIDPSGFRFGPGSEGILHAVEHGLQGGEMAQQDGGHVVVHYPIEADL